MIRRTMSPTLFDEVANHPEVRPWLGGGTGPLDTRPWVENPAVFCLEADKGGFVFHPILAGVYELHTMFLPEGRGKALMDAAREAWRYMFTQTDALEIVTKCPDDNTGARMASSQHGFRERFRREDAWAPGVGISYRVLSVDDWIARDQACADEGLAFHLALDAAKDAAGSKLPTHPHDEAHDRVVGAAVMMAKAGNMAKAVGLYERWRVFSGYGPIEALSNTLVDVGDAIVSITPGGIEALLVRGVS